MLITRKIGSVLRGRATRTQVFLAALLAGLLGFVPGFFLPGDLRSGFGQAPGLIASLVFLVLILNANLAVFSVVLLVAKLVSLPLLPISLQIGRALIDGPLQPLFRSLANAPVFAWFGFEYYATTGGLLLGLVFGVVAGILLVRALATFRRRMAGLESESERYQKLAKSRSLSFLAWLFLGSGKGKKTTWQELAENQRKGSPVRPLGIVAVLVIGGILFVFLGMFATPILTENLRTSLTAANGATVDVQRAELSFTDGRLAIHGLAVADSGNLTTDVFRADLLEATVDTGELLRKRFVIDAIRSRDAASGVPRAVPGVRTEAPPAPPPPPQDPDVKTIDDYLEDIEVWRERIDQVREWLGKIAGSDDPVQETPEERERRIERDAALYGPAMVVAEHLRDEQPAVVIRTIDIEGIRVDWLGGETVDLRASTLSTAPSLLPTPPALSFATRTDKLKAEVAGPSKGQPDVSLLFKMTGVPVDSVFGGLKIAGAAPLRGGTIDIASSGKLLLPGNGAAMVEMPLSATLRDTLFAIPGAKETKVEQLLLPIGVQGPMLRPAVVFDDRVLANALLAAGKQELANFVQQNAGKLLGNVPGAEGLIEAAKNPEQLLETVQDPTKLLEEARKKAEEEARKQLEEQARKQLEEQAKKAAEEAAKKGVGETLRGILPGGRKN